MTTLKKLDTDIAELDESIDALNENLEKSNSFRSVFLRGIVSGTATAMGASIVAAIVLTMIIWSLHTVEYIPFFKRIVEVTGIEKLLERSSNP